ncbi:hypothetical protein Tco_0947892 [Tanacetum coccineum]
MAEQDIPPPTITAMKIPIIRKGEYDICSMRMQQYICHTDHNLWDVIVNGDLEEEPAPTRETSAPPAPKTAKQLAARRNQERVTAQVANIKDLKAQNKQLKKKARPIINHHKAWIKNPTFDDLDDAIDYMETKDAHDEGTIKDSEGLDLRWQDFGHEKNELAWGEKYEFQNYELKCREIKINNLNLELEKVFKERDELKDKIAKWEESSKNLDEILNSQMSARDKTGLGYSTQLNELSSIHETDSENSFSVFNGRSSDEESTLANDRSPLPYNGIIGRPGIREIQVVSSTDHGMLKFPTNGGIVTIRSTILIPAECTIVITSSKEKKRRHAMERSKAIQEEVQKLVEAGIIREVYYHDWLSNPIMVKKHDGSWSRFHGHNSFIL